MLKVLYFCHVSWGWIKQRPQFIAENLAQSNLVTVVTDMVYSKRTEVNSHSTKKSVKIIRLARLPFGRISIIRKINNIIKKYQVAFLIRKNKIAWFSDPKQYILYRPLVKGRCNIVYDCMDDMLNFPNEKEISEKVRAYEKILVNDADIVFCSSQDLAAKIKLRYQKEVDTVINNGLHIYKNHSISSSFEFARNVIRKNTGCRILYIGTISSWFDFVSILQNLEKQSDTYYYLIGPTDVKIPSHPRLVHIPPVSHQDVLPLLNEADILIMPFLLSELIQSVNPVKLYEYVFAEKPIIARKYSETEVFSEFVYLYSTSEEYCQLIEMIRNGNCVMKSTSERCKQFSESNTWSARIRVMEEVIRKKVEIC